MPGERAVGGGGEQFQGVPVVLPGPARVLIGIENREAGGRATAAGVSGQALQVEAGGQPCLAAADDQDIDMAGIHRSWRGLHGHTHRSSSIWRIASKAAGTTE
ncbi:Uncharacterised protein [Streptococcus pneumoniae]|nr:Uncharacterised protein [Streptococcus pneumoniae]